MPYPVDETPRITLLASFARFLFPLDTMESDRSRIQAPPPMVPTPPDPPPIHETQQRQQLALGAGAGEGRLHVFPGVLLDGATLMDAALGSSGAFHLTTPCIIFPVSDPLKLLAVPAVEGRLNVLRAAKEARTVCRVVNW